MSYDKDSREARLGNGFRDYLVGELRKRGLAFSSTEKLCESKELGYRAQFDASYGDATNLEIDVQFECKTSEKYNDSVTVSANGRTNFLGSRKFYVTSFAKADGDEHWSFENIKAFRAADVQARLLDLKSDTGRLGEKQTNGKRWQVFQHASLVPYASGIDELAESLKQDFRAAAAASL